MKTPLVSVSSVASALVSAALALACSPSGPAPAGEKTGAAVSGAAVSGAAVSGAAVSSAVPGTAPSETAPPDSAGATGGTIPRVTIPATASGPAGASGPAPASLPTGFHALQGTNLAIRMPGQVQMLPMDFGGPGFLIKGEKGCEVMVKPVDSGLPRTLDEVRARIQADTIRWRQFNRIEGSPQGWVVEYETDGIGDPTKTAYGVNVRVNIAGEEVACSRVLATPEAAKCALAACQSLRHQD